MLFSKVVVVMLTLVPAFAAPIARREGGEPAVESTSYEAEVPHTYDHRPSEHHHKYASHHPRLTRRGKKDNVHAYLDNIVVSNLSGSFGRGSWNRVHGDTKSGTGGTYHMEIMMTSNNVPQIKLIGHPKGSSTTAQCDAATLDSCISAIKAKV